MIFVRLIIMLGIVYLCGKLIDFLRHRQESSNLSSYKYLFLSVICVLIFTSLLSTIYLIVIGESVGPFLSIFLITLAIAIGLETSKAVSSAQIRISTVVFLSLGLGVVIWPSLYFLAYLTDTMNPKSTLLTKIGVLQFVTIAIGSTLMPMAIEQLAERYL